MAALWNTRVVLFVFFYLNYFLFIKVNTEGAKP